MKTISKIVFFIDGEEVVKTFPAFEIELDDVVTFNKDKCKVKDITFTLDEAYDSDAKELVLFFKNVYLEKCG